MAELPAELWLKVAQFADISSLTSLSRCCKGLHRIAIPRLYRRVSFNHKHLAETVEGVMISEDSAPAILAGAESIPLPPDTQPTLEAAFWENSIQRGRSASKPFVDFVSLLYRKPDYAALIRVLEVSLPDRHHTPFVDWRPSLANGIEVVPMFAETIRTYSVTPQKELDWRFGASAQYDVDAHLAVSLPKLVNLRCLFIGAGVNKFRGHSLDVFARLVSDKHILTKIPRLAYAVLKQTHCSSWLHIEHLTACLKSPSMTALCLVHMSDIIHHLDAPIIMKELSNLPPRTSPIKTLVFRPSQIGSNVLCSALNAIKGLTTFIHSIWGVEEDYRFNAADVHHALLQHRDSLQNLGLELEIVDGDQAKEIFKFDDARFPSLKRFYQVRCLKIALCHITGCGNDYQPGFSSLYSPSWGVPPDLPFRYLDPTNLAEFLPPNLEELHITDTDAQLVWLMVMLMTLLRTRSTKAPKLKRIIIEVPYLDYGWKNFECLDEPVALAANQGFDLKIIDSYHHVDDATPVMNWDLNADVHKQWFWYRWSDW